MCKKARFSDELGAKIALEKQHRNGHKKPKECVRYYPCKRCRGYHLTSEEFNLHSNKKGSQEKG